MAKASKSEAHYRDGTATKRCGKCRMFEPPHGCTAVEGEIEASGLCDYFERKRAPLYEGK